MHWAAGFCYHQFRHRAGLRTFDAYEHGAAFTAGFVLTSKSS